MENHTTQSKLTFAEPSILETQQPATSSPELSQREFYHFGQNSAAQPDGYTYALSNSDLDVIDLHHLANLISGAGHFQKSDGSTLNIV